MTGAHLCPRPLVCSFAQVGACVRDLLDPRRPIPSTSVELRDRPTLSAPASDVRRENLNLNARSAGSPSRAARDRPVIALSAPRWRGTLTGVPDEDAPVLLMCREAASVAKKPLVAGGLFASCSVGVTGVPFWGAGRRVCGASVARWEPSATLTVRGRRACGAGGSFDCLCGMCRFGVSAGREAAWTAASRPSKPWLTGRISRVPSPPRSRRRNVGCFLRSGRA